MKKKKKKKMKKKVKIMKTKKMRKMKVKNQMNKKKQMRKKIQRKKINKLFIKEGEKKPIKEFLNNKRERTKDKTIEDKNFFENEFHPKTEFKLFGNIIENKDLNNTKDEFLYIGCEDGNIKLVKINNERIFDIFFK